MEPRPYSSLTPSTHVKASVWIRLVAYIIDGVIIAVPVYLLARIVPMPQLLMQVIIGLILCLRDTLPVMNGQSVGKKLMGLKVIKETTGEGIKGDYETGFKRGIPLAIPYLGLVDALVIFRDTSKRFGDDWANTTVVKA